MASSIACVTVITSVIVVGMFGVLAVQVTKVYEIPVVKKYKLCIYVNLC